MLMRQGKKSEKNFNNDLESMKIAKENIYKQASMAILAVVVTVVLVFAMSVAWYSNVIHTEGLIFQASSWDFNFEGDIVIGDEKTKVAPGDAGIIPMKVENESEEAITVLVNVTKSTEDFGNMKNRIYFYVDDNQEVNGEKVDKIYVNETEEYAYTLLGKNTLVMNDDYNSDPYLKWEWVYDVLGYYVMGTLDENTMTIEDYMRPVIYDYDKATYDNEGNLRTVDGGTTKKEFLKQLYETDGFQGKNVPEDQNGYYPVMVDEETNQGIWLYLCTQPEIEASIKEDTVMGEEAAEKKAKEFTARLLLSGQKKKEAEMQVADAADLKAQLNAEDIDKVTLSGDISVSSTIKVEKDRQVILDLDNNTLKMSVGDASSIQVEEGSSLTIINGTIEGTGKECAIETLGASITLDNVIIENVKRGLYVRDDAATGLDSRVKITNCNLNVEDIGVMIRGNGTVSSRKTYLLIEKTTITGGTYGITGNGSDSASGTELEINQCTISGTYAGIYHPQADSYMNIVNSTIKGKTGIAVKAGTVNITNTTVHGSGGKGEPAFATSGFTDTGDAIYIETNYGKEIALNVAGANSIITSDNSYAIQVYDSKASHVIVTATGGKYSSDVTDFIPVGYAITEEVGNYIVHEAEATFEETE